MSLEPRLAGWTRDVCDAALVLLVAVCLLTIALGRVLPLTGRTTLAVAGGSMEPAIHLGSAIVVEPVDPRSLAVGDVVSLRSGPDRAIFSHRIIRVVVRDGDRLDRDQGRRQRRRRSVADTGQPGHRESLGDHPDGRVPDRAPVVAPRDRLRRFAGSRADPRGVDGGGPRPCTAPERGAVATGGTRFTHRP